MSINAVRNVTIQSVTLDANNKTSAVKSHMSVFPLVEINPTAGSGTGSDFSNIRIRVVVSYSKHSCQMIDYISQRFSEYQGLKEVSPLFGTTVAPANFVSFLRSDMLNKGLGEDCLDPYDYLEENSPISPFSTKAAVIHEVFKKRYSYEGNGIKLPPATVMFDAPLIGLVDPKVASLLNKGDYAGFGADSIHLDPIHFKFTEVNIEDSSQLSVYAYAYELSENEIEQDQISLTTGMTRPSSYSLVGQKTIWRPISLQTPMIGIGYRGAGNEYTQTTTEDSPNRDRLIVLSTVGSSMVFLNSLLELQRNLYDPNTAPVLQRRNGIRQIIKKSNFFSDFWITKDSDENNRFMFAFDLESYLAEKSHFAYLYKRQVTSRQILDGTGLMTRQTPSYIMNMGVRRIFIDPPSMLPINDLGTSGYSTELEPTPSYPVKRIFEIRKIDKLTIPDMNQNLPNGKFSFYEGKDILDKDQNLDHREDGAFRYGTEYTVYDGSVIFVREALKQIMLYRNIMRDLYDKIIAAPSDPFRMRENNSDLMNIYNDNSGFLNVGSNHIVLYSKIMSSFLDSSEASMYQYFRERLLSTESYLEVAIIEEMVRYMDMFIHLLYRRLSEFFPTNPLGRDIPSSESNDFESRGLLEYRAPFLRDSHYFDNKVMIGEDYGFGVDYVMEQEKDEGHHNGLARIDISDYRLRAGNEIGKYFFQPGVRRQQDLYESVGSQLGDVTDRFLTPLIVRVPNRKPLLQIQETNRSTYPLDRYAQLFVDTFRHKSLLHPSGLHDPLIIDSDPSLGQNERLYDSVVNLLHDHHEVSIEEETDFVYPSLDVITGKQIKTTEVDELEKKSRLIKNGPRLIPTLIGGNVDLSSTTRSYITAVDTSLTSRYPINQDGYVDSKRKEAKNRSRPIKLPFAIFGELSIDPQINLSMTYQDKMFNSLKMLSNKLGLGTDNIASIFSEDIGGVVPASVKSMLVIASTKEDNTFGTLGYDAVRPVLEEQNSNSADQNISVKIFGDGNSFQTTGDPMKIYAKFMAFWMNYKQIAVIECLSNFGSLKSINNGQSPEQDGSRLQKLKMPVWSPLTRDLLLRIEKENVSILCRARNYSLGEYIQTLLPETQSTVHALLTQVRKNSEDYGTQMFNFPVYNEYFILGDEPLGEDIVGSPKNKTSENECHDHTYSIDAKGNGWTSEAQHLENQNVKHKHQILNFEVQTSQSDCYPDCEVQYGVKGAEPHIHELLGEEMTNSSTPSFRLDLRPGAGRINQVGVSTTSVINRGGY